MISRNQIKFIKSLRQKKYRERYGLFVVEGEKLVGEFLKSDFEIKNIYATNQWEGDAIRISENELQRISSLKKANKVLATVYIPKEINSTFGNTVIALDGVKDPGNLGTIIRLADWFGVRHILCSFDCVELYNSKVVQASMGSIARVHVLYTDLKNQLCLMKDYQTVATVLDGKDVFKAEYEKKVILLMGSESHGIGKELVEISNVRVAIPKDESSEAESLNVATACGIILAQFKN